VVKLRSCTDSVFEQHVKKGIPCFSYDIGTCSGPCVGKVLSQNYHVEVNEIVNFLEGRVSELTEKLIAQRDEYSQAMAFEKAKMVQDRLLALLKLQANTRFLTQAVHQNHLLIVLPHYDKPRLLLLYVYKGRPLQKQVFDPRLDSVESILERVSFVQTMLGNALGDKPDAIQKAEVEEIRIIAHWLKYQQADEPEAKVFNLTEPLVDLKKDIYQYFQEKHQVISLEPEWSYLD